MACDGQTVVVAVNVDGDDPYVWTSFDGGTTFKQTKINEDIKITDLQVSGKRWTLLGYKDSGSAYDRWGRVFFSTSADGGATVSTENIDYAAANGKTYSTSDCLNNPSFAYHPQMVQQGDIIDLMYEGSLSNGNEGDPDPGYDYGHTSRRAATEPSLLKVTTCIFLPPVTASMPSITHTMAAKRGKYSGRVCCGIVATSGIPDTLSNSTSLPTILQDSMSS